MNEVCGQQSPHLLRKGRGTGRFLLGLKHQAQPLGATRPCVGLPRRRQALVQPIPTAPAQVARAGLDVEGVVEPTAAPTALHWRHGWYAVCGRTQPPAKGGKGLEAEVATDSVKAASNWWNGRIHTSRGALPCAKGPWNSLPGASWHARLTLPGPDWGRLRGRRGRDVGQVGPQGGKNTQNQTPYPCGV